MPAEARLAPLGARLALQVIDRIEAGTAQGVKQDQRQATKAPKLKKEHGLIDWARPARDVCNQIRAMQPWPTAYTFRRRSAQTPIRHIILRASPSEGPSGDAAPGDLLVRPEAPTRLLVAAAPGGLVEVKELQPAGKRRMTAAEYLRGHPLQAGDRFGPETA